MSRPRRVPIVTWELQPDSGWGRYSLGLVRGLLERGIELTILTDRRSTWPPIAARMIPCLSSPLAPLDRPLPFAWNLGQVWRNARGHDLVHFFVEPYALAASAVFPWPYLITVHGTYGVSPLRMNPVTRTLFTRTMRRAASVVCVSGYTRRRVAEALHLDNLEVVRNGLEPVKAPAGRFDGSIEGGPVLMAAGALKPRKGYHTTLEALPRVRDRYPDVHYYLVGDDQDRKYVDGLRRTIERLDLTRNATITGRIDEAYLDALYRRADAFVLPAENSGGAFEGFGLTYLEANAYGKPVVGTLDCGAEDAIDDGENGLLVPQRDPGAVADAVLRLLDDPPAASAMGERGRQRALRRDWSHVVDEYLTIYEKVVRRRLRREVSS
jgi:glycosyltransferase involved in cell wall biosynthesis